jgi:hypothetical protein
MPLSKYFSGHGEGVMAKMVKQYGAKKGKSVFYATANKQSGVKRTPPPDRKRKVTEDFQTYHLKKGASKRGVAYYSKGGVHPKDRPRPD